jgi:hypothetical protein
MLTTRRMSRGWEKLNNCMTLLVDEENIMIDSGHCKKR